MSKNQFERKLSTMSSVEEKVEEFFKKNFPHASGGFPRYCRESIYKFLKYNKAKPFTLDKVEDQD